MSTSIASSAATVGLLDRHYSPTPIRDSQDPTIQATDWSDKGVETVEETVKETPSKSHPTPADQPNQSQPEKILQPEPESKTDLPESQTKVEPDERRETIGGLLAALATGSNAQTSDSATRQDAVAPVEQKHSVAAPSDIDLKQSVSITRRTPSAPPQSPISVISHDEEEHSDESFDRANLAVSYGQTQDSLMSGLEDTGPMVAREILPPPNRQIQISAEDIQAMQRYQEEHPVNLEAFPMHVDHEYTQESANRPATPINIKRQYDAFARLEFPDGIFYLNTFSCELGRDAHAYQDALRREKEAMLAAQEEENQPKSSSGKASQRIHSIKASESQIQRSVVSESGGFAGVDDQPIAKYGDKKDSGNEKHSSQESNNSLVRPADLLRDPSLVPYDYHKDVVYHPAPDVDDGYEDNERPAPVTAEHMPDPYSVPLIPIHPTAPQGSSGQSDVTNLKNISRRHIRIAWDWKRHGWYLHVLGRNGAFFQGKHIDRGAVVRLYQGACIQVSAVEFIFRLPNTVTEVTEIDDSSSPVSSRMEASPALPVDGQGLKLKLKVNGDGSPTQLATAEMKRRGPGRPPKNGVMSQREMKEREKAEKEAKTQALTGQSAASHHPALQRKPSKSQLPKPETEPETAKTEKRKYTKRKREDGEEEEVVMPSIEPHEPTPQTQTPAAQATPSAPPPKRARTRSESPPIPPRDSYTEEQLLRPSANYAILLYEILKKTGEISLKRIYREMQIKHPFFAYGVTSDGWTSSIRHNLNAEVDKLFRRVRKDGKGFTWDAIPNALEVYTQNKKQRTNPTVPKPRPPPSQSQNIPASQGTQLQWQNPNTQAGRPAGPGGSAPNTNVARREPLGNSSGPPPLPPSFVPRDEDMHLYLKYPTPPHLPVSFEGLAVIYRFQQTMMKAVATDPEKEKRWKAIFDSVRARCLRGASASILPEGEVPDEAMILEHVRKFCNVYKNPRFVSFNALPSPAPQPSSTVPTAAPQQNNAPAQQGSATSQARPPTVSTTPVSTTTAAHVANATPNSAVSGPTTVTNQIGQTGAGGTQSVVATGSVQRNVAAVPGSNSTANPPADLPSGTNVPHSQPSTTSTLTTSNKVHGISDPNGADTAQTSRPPTDSTHVSKAASTQPDHATVQARTTQPSITGTEQKTNATGPIGAVGGGPQVPAQLVKSPSITSQHTASGTTGSVPSTSAQSIASSIVASNTIPGTTSSNSLKTGPTQSQSPLTKPSIPTVPGKSVSVNDRRTAVPHESPATHGPVGNVHSQTITNHSKQTIGADNATPRQASNAPVKVNAQPLPGQRAANSENSSSQPTTSTMATIKSQKSVVAASDGTALPSAQAMSSSPAPKTPGNVAVGGLDASNQNRLGSNSIQPVNSSNVNANSKAPAAEQTSPSVNAPTSALSASNTGKTSVATSLPTQKVPIGKTDGAVPDAKVDNEISSTARPSESAPLDS